MQPEFEKAIELVKGAKSIQVVTHIDADGLSAGGIISQALERAGKDFEIRVVSGIYQDTVKEFEPGDLTIFSDLGSGQLDLLERDFSGEQVIVLDHHQVFGSGWPGLVQINPSLQNLDGARAISGAGLAYLFAKSLDKENTDLSKLAVVGAVGDIQNFWGKMEGLNAEILKEAVESKTVSIDNDLLLFGRFTRPVYKALQYFTDPFVPDISNSESGCVSLLNSLEVPLKVEEKWRTLSDLNQEEKRKIADVIIERAMVKIPKELQSYVPGLVIGENYTLENEDETKELKDASEFSTCLNACGRNNEPGIGLKIAQGERDTYYKQLISLLQKHRKNLAQGLTFVEMNGISLGPKKYLQYFNADSNIAGNIIGTIAGMVLGSEYTDPYKPIIGLASTENGVKVSARCSRILVLQGIDMAGSIREAARAVGGVGGGHNVACGALVPEDNLKEFIEKFENGLVVQKPALNP